MKDWKLLKIKEVYYISNSNMFDKNIIRNNLTRKEALNFWKILTKLRS